MPKLFEITDAYTPEETIDSLPVEPVLSTERPRVIINTAEFDKPKPDPLWDDVEGFKNKVKSGVSGIGDAIKYASELDQKFTSSIVNFPKKAYENSDDLVKGIKNLFGLGEEERYQLWPEKVVKEALTSAGDIAKPNPYPEGSEQWQFYENKRQEGMVPAAMAISALAGSGGLAGTGAKAGEVALGATPFLRPALKHKDRLYKGKPGQEHQDIIPKELYQDFQRKAMSGEDLAEYNFGFINDKGHFLDREKALKYGIDTGIIDPHSGKFGALTTTLMADSSKPGVAIESLAKANAKMPMEAIGLNTKAGTYYEVLKNPSKSDILSLGKDYPTMGRDAPQMRVMKVGDDTYAWPATYATHDQISKSLGIKHPGFDNLDNVSVTPKGLSGGKKDWNILFADSSKPGTAIEAMAKSANPFYSAVEHTVKNISQDKMTGEQWLGTIANKPGVKPEELDWTGLSDFLAENKGKPVTKAQIEEHLAANKVELKEVRKGQVDENSPEFKNEVESILKLRPNMMRSVAEDMAHENILNKFDGETKYQSYQLPGGPLSRDTEILTDKGWKRIDAVEVGDVVMTRKDEAGILEWQPVQVIPKVYAEELYHFFSQSINMRVTENHQMIAKKRRRNNEGLQRLTAKELWNKSEMLVPLTGVWEGGETENIFGFDPHDLAELFGWYLAEGSYKHKNGNKHTIQIAQCKEYNPEKCARLEALLDRMGLPWRYYGQAYGIGIKTINKDLVELFYEQPTSEFKFVPYFFFNQSKSIIQSLLDGLILGDGCIHINEGRLDRTVFYTKSEQLAGDVQILILLIGKNANVRQRPSGLYCVGIKSKEWSSVDDAKFEIAPYNDFAFCVTVENHAIYVRRNGVAAFTGNSNYREMLLTLPQSKLSPEIAGKNLYDNFIYKGGGQTWEQLAPETRQHWIDRATEQGRGTDFDPSKTYRSSHWDEPNILAHVRMNDRTVDGKKSLHLEEIQSDWHQQGRDQGYKQSKTKDWKITGNDKDGYEIKSEGVPLWEGTTRQAAERQLADMQSRNVTADKGVPDAPFKKSWHELALKRMIREASEKGYDRLSWTPGEAQAERYSLAKQVDKIAVPMVNKDGTRSVRIDAKEGTPFKLMVDKDGKVTGSGASSDQFSGKPLSDVVGKEMAEKIMKLDKSHEFSGVDLKIGGEGMKGFYNQIIPKSVNKIAKEYGVKVEKGKTSEGHDIFYIDLPEGLKNTALRKGFPLFSNVHPGYSFIPYAGNPFENEK